MFTQYRVRHKDTEVRTIDHGFATATLRFA